MKKLSKVLALISGAVMATCTMSGISANAIYMPVDFPFTAPEGYTEVNDNGYIASILGTEDDCIVYVQRIDYSQLDPDDYDEQIDAEKLCIYYDFQYDYTRFNVESESIDAFEEIYAKYSEKLDFSDYHKYSDEIIMYNEYGSEGKPDNVEDKSEVILQMTKELYEAGCIQKAEYKPLIAHLTHGFSFGSLVELNTGSITDEEKQAEYSKLSEITSSFEYGAVEIGENRYFTTINYVDIANWCEAVKESYPNSNPSGRVMMDSNTSTVESASIDLLAAIGETDKNGITYGDINTDGRIGIGDAIAINKFVNGSIILNEEQTKAADLNSDGTVNGDDLYTMLRYLVDDIDTLPLTE